MLVYLAVTFSSYSGLFAEERKLRSSADLDGVHVTVGPVGALIEIEDEWTTGAGAELSVVRITEHAFPAMLGIAAGGVGYTERDGGRFWLEAEGAIQAPLPFAVGIGLGTTMEANRTDPPRWGVQGTLFVFAGIIPYVRAGVLDTEGSFVEAGVMVKIPALRY